MTLLAVERLKLFTTRSPWWCALITLVLTIGFAALITANADDRDFAPTVASTQFGYGLGMAVIMVLAALSVTTDQIGETAAAKGITLHELSLQRGSLEQAFMQMTGDSVQYHATDATQVSAVTQAEAIVAKEEQI